MLCPCAVHGRQRVRLWVRPNESGEATTLRCEAGCTQEDVELVMLPTIQSSAYLM